MKEKIILIGGGGHCKSCIDVIEQESKFDILGIVDIKEKIGQNIFNYMIIATDNELVELRKRSNNFIITIGQIARPIKRIHIYNKLKHLGVVLPIIISPFSYVSKHASIGEGSIVMHNAVINAGAQIGKNCIINTSALIEHDVVIGDHCHISTSAVINGGVEIGNGTFYGSGAVSKQYIKIKSNSFIKANSIIKY